MIDFEATFRQNTIYFEVKQMEEIISNIYQTPENTNPNVLRDQLQSIAGDKLPPVGPDDKGKVLTTNETTGAPEWAEASGGGGGDSGGALVVHATASDDGYGNPIYTLDKTAGEIIAAARAGYVVLDNYTGLVEGSACMPLVTAFADSKEGKIRVIFGMSKGGTFNGLAPTENDYPVSEGVK